MKDYQKYEEMLKKVNMPYIKEYYPDTKCIGFLVSGSTYITYHIFYLETGYLAAVGAFGKNQKGEKIYRLGDK